MIFDNNFILEKENWKMSTKKKSLLMIFKILSIVIDKTYLLHYKKFSSICLSIMYVIHILTCLFTDYWLCNRKYEYKLSNWELPIALIPLVLSQKKERKDKKWRINTIVCVCLYFYQMFLLWLNNEKHKIVVIKSIEWK